MSVGDTAYTVYALWCNTQRLNPRGVHPHAVYGLTVHCWPEEMFVLLVRVGCPFPHWMCGNPHKKHSELILSVHRQNKIPLCNMVSTTLSWICWKRSIREKRVKLCVMFAYMMTSSMDTFSAVLALYAENSPVTGDLPSPRPVTRSFGVFFDLRTNKC